MKVPLEWLRQYISTKKEAREIASDLTSIGHMLDGQIQFVNGGEVLDLEVRQNRPDCLSIIGIARELAGIANVTLKYPPTIKNALFSPKGNYKISIENDNACYRFNTLKIDGIKIATSPQWLINALNSYGMDSINNLVDITNYVMIEYGQPLHAFDAARLEGRITIRNAARGEKFTALGEKKLTLVADDLVITDQSGIIALAGIIGGNNSGITPKTTSIILEAATYNQASIRRTSIRHALRTEASTRLEKFLHPQLTSIALCRAAYLIKEVCGGTIASCNDVYPQKKSITKLKVSVARTNQLGGVTIEKKQMIAYLESLEFEVTPGTSDIMTVAVPYFRTDITCEEDLIEEIVRMHGYDKIPTILPSSPVPQSIQSKLYDFEETIRDVLLALGFDEHITEPLVNENESALEPVVLQNSLTSEKSMLRTQMKDSLLTVLDTYKKHKREVGKIFEIGKIYFKEKNSYKEVRTLGILFSAFKISFVDIKGVVATLSSQIGRAISDDCYTIVPIDTTTWFAQINIELLYNCKHSDPISVLSSPPQVVSQDFSLVAPIKTKVGDVIKTIHALDRTIYEVTLGEEPKQIDDDSKSLFLHILFRDPSDANLSKVAVDKLRTEILTVLKTNYNITLPVS